MAWYGDIKVNLVGYIFIGDYKRSSDYERVYDRLGRIGLTRSEMSFEDPSDGSTAHVWIDTNKINLYNKIKTEFEDDNRLWFVNEKGYPVHKDLVDEILKNQK